MFACADLGLTQACLAAKGPLTWAMVVAAIRRSVRLACRSLPPRWWKTQKVRHEPQTREPRTHGRRLAGVTPGFEKETLFLLAPCCVYHLDRLCIQMEALS